MKKVFLLMASVAVLCFAGCSSSSDDVIEVSSVTLNLQSKSLLVGETVTLTATVSPDNAYYTSIVWGSGNESIATVTQEGVVTAVAEGTATITATAGGKSALCVITVTEEVIEVTSVTLDITSAELLTDETLTLTATVLPDNATDSSVTWSSSDETIATVDEDGVVTCVSGGTVTITATAGTKSAECVIECIDENPNISSFFDPAFASILQDNGIVADATAITYSEVKGRLWLELNNCELTSLAGIEFFTALQSLFCMNNELVSLDVSKNTKLNYLACQDNRLTFLDVSNNTVLDCLTCENNLLTSLNLGDDSYIRILHTQNNNLTSLDLSMSTRLAAINCSNNQLTFLDLSNNAVSATLNCSDNPGENGYFYLYTSYEGRPSTINAPIDSWQYNGNEVSINWLKKE